ncbi:hypothetical protein G6F58_013225 [Rhizopus delemar]|nr:hypothetical protein G6F58_013225 [Rhizopus delemar]
MAAENAPAKTAVKVAKPAAKTAAKKATKTAAADKPEKVTKARAMKAEDKLADLVGGSARPAGPSGRRPGRPAKNANNDSDGFDDTMDGEGENTKRAATA